MRKGCLTVKAITSLIYVITFCCRIFFFKGLPTFVNDHLCSVIFTEHTYNFASLIQLICYS